MAARNKEAPYPRVAEFYNGKSVFMTGASGYLGVLILETLLELCPGINKVYILLREKRGVSPEKRKDELLERSVFDKVRKNMPEVLDKIKLVRGDVSLPDFGMDEDDLQQVVENASIVFHIAAIINFKKSLKYTLQHNAVSTQYAIDICRKLRKLDAFVYTSSSYSNCNRNSVLQEEIYRLPFHAQRFLDEISNGTDESLDQLVAECLPLWPNFYTFSKSLAENVIQDNASDLPVIIVRPSIIGSVWKRPLPGYIEEASGIPMLTIGKFQEHPSKLNIFLLGSFKYYVGKGFLRVLPGDPNNIFNFVPGDICASTHIIAAWSVATNRSPPLHVINNASCVVATMQRYIDIMQKVSKEQVHVFPNAFRLANKFIFIKNPMEYKIMAFYEHYVPAFCFDLLLKIRGSKLRLVPIYKMADKAMEALRYFVMNHWDFNTENFQSLLSQLQEEDIKLFELDETTCSGEEFAQMLPNGAPSLQRSVDKKSKEERMKSATRNLYLTYLFQALFLLGVAMMLYFVFLILSGLFH